jgi:hypothetical protein
LSDGGTVDRLERVPPGADRCRQHQENASMATPARLALALLSSAIALLSPPLAAQQQLGGQARDYASSSPYSGMFGSMGNVYHPHYRQFQTPAMGGMAGPYRAPGTYGLGMPGYVDSPYSGMYGSMGNIYHPYYREPQTPSMSGMSGGQTTPGRFGTGAPGQVVNPYPGMYGSMGNVYHPYYR